MEYWNHNVHYQSVILDAVAAGCTAALDVGCGDGMLAAKLASCCAAVTGIDRDARMIALARKRAPDLTFVEADFLAHPFADASFDFVCSNTVAHHMGTEAALRAMVRVLRPGGRLAVFGLGKNGSLTDFLPDLAAIPLNKYYQRTRGEGYPGDPKLPPDLTWAQVRETARRVLPGVRYRRHLLWRYSLIWDKPLTRAPASSR